MINPFDVPDTEYTVLRNPLGQHSLWLAELAEPDGWVVLHGPASRSECLGYVRRHWIDLRPSDVAEFITAVTR